MDWRRGPWRKLFLREPTEQQALPWATRGLRNLLLQIARDDGRVGSREALMRALRGDELLEFSIDDLLDDGFLVELDGQLIVKNLSVAQARPQDRAPTPTTKGSSARSEAAARAAQARWAGKSEGERREATRRASESRWSRDAGPPSSRTDERTELRTETHGPPHGERTEPTHGPPHGERTDNRTETHGAAHGDSPCVPRASSGQDLSSFRLEEEKREEEIRAHARTRAHGERTELGTDSTHASDARTDARRERTHGVDLTDSDRETPIPIDLPDRAERLGVVGQLAERLNVAEADVRSAIEEFHSYWTVGEGTGKRRAHWMGRLREHVRRGVLSGKIPKVGERRAVEADPDMPPSWKPPPPKKRAPPPAVSPLDSLPPLPGAPLVGTSETASSEADG